MSQDQHSFGCNTNDSAALQSLCEWPADDTCPQVKSHGSLEVFSLDAMRLVHMKREMLPGPLTPSHKTRKNLSVKEFVVALRQCNNLRVCHPAVEPLGKIRPVADLGTKLFGREAFGIDLGTALQAWSVFPRTQGRCDLGSSFRRSYRF